MNDWGILPFENYDASGWIEGLEGAADLSYVEETLVALDDCEMYLEASLGRVALAACEVLARLLGNFGYQNPDTEAVDRWVKANPIVPPKGLLDRADWVISLVMGPQSELRGSWDTSQEKAWIEAVKDLQRRLKS